MKGSGWIKVSFTIYILPSCCVSTMSLLTSRSFEALAQTGGLGLLLDSESSDWSVCHIENVYNLGHLRLSTSQHSEHTYHVTAISICWCEEGLAEPSTLTKTGYDRQGILPVLSCGHSPFSQWHPTAEAQSVVSICEVPS